MGNTTSSERDSALALHHTDPENGLSYLFDPASNHYVLREVSCDSLQEIMSLSHLFEKRACLRHPHLGRLLEMVIEQDQRGARILSECPFRTLEDQRTDRTFQSDTFEEDELWSILASLILVMAYLQRHHVPHSGLRTHNIYLDNQGVVKVVDPLAKGYLSNYQLMLEDSFAQTYLSPNEMSCLLEKRPQPLHNLYKSDVYTLGIIVLELGLLESQQHIYQRESINQMELQESIHRLKLKYSGDLAYIVQMMVEINQLKRLDWLRLEEFVRQDQHTLGDTGISEFRRQVGPSKEVYHTTNAHTALQRSVSLNKSLHENGLFFPEDESNLSSTPIQLRQQPPQRQDRIVPQEHEFYDHLHQTPLNVLRSNDFNLVPKGSFINDSHAFPSKISNQTLLLQYQSPFMVLQQDPVTTQREKIAPTSKIDDLPPNSHQTVWSAPTRGHSTIDRSIQISGVHLAHVSTGERKPSTTSNSIQTSICHPQQQHPSQQMAIPLIPVEVLTQSRISSQPEPPDQKNTFRSQGKENADPPSKKQPMLKNGRFYPAESDPDLLYPLPFGRGYTGEMKDGVRDGKGVYFHPAKGIYDGQWLNNKMHGYGKLYSPEGKLRYKGEWEADHIHGRGVLYTNNTLPQQQLSYWDFIDVKRFAVWYDGEFSMDKKKGRGVLRLSSGDTLEGNFDGDRIEGKATFRSKDVTVKGVWANSRLESILSIE